MPIKKKPLFCKNHPRIKSSGVCRKCGKPVCSSCSIIFKGHHYCISNCLPQEVITASQSGSQKSAGIPKNILVWTTITGFLCLIALSSWGAREYILLQQENNLLKESRQHLISSLKSNNHEIDELKAHEEQNTSTLTPISYLPQNSKKSHFQYEQENQYAPRQSSSLSFNNGGTDKKLVSLTFDGGSDANTAIPILDTLHSRNIKVTIFLTGQFIKKFPDIVHLCLKEGHEIGNHTMTHPHLTSYAQDRTQTTLPNVSREFICQQLSSNDEEFFKITGHHMSGLWRAPFGDINNTICKWALDCGYQHVGWRQGHTWLENLDSNDWIPDEETPGFKTPSEVMDKILGMARSNSNALNGGIILMHLGTSRSNHNMQVVTILGSLIDSLQQRGYKIVPVSEMMQQSSFYLASLPSTIHFSDTTIK